jgi:hypothetical protein
MLPKKQKWFAAIGRQKLLDESIGLTEKRKSFWPGRDYVRIEQEFVFAHPDIEQRKEVIKGIRECRFLFIETENEELSGLRKDLAKSKQHHVNEVIIWTAFGGMFFIWIGLALIGLIGAVIGGFAALLIGMYSMSSG